MTRKTLIITTDDLSGDGTKLVDEFRTWWQLEPHDAPPAVPTAVLNAPGALRVGGDVKAPILTHRVEPIYTVEARRARIFHRDVRRFRHQLTSFALPSARGRCRWIERPERPTAGSPSS